MKFEVISKENIGVIKPLWNRLNQLHGETSEFFTKVFENTTFETRIKGFNSIEDKNFRLEVVLNSDDLIGYCLSTINEKDKTGCIESLYIDDEFRNLKLGMTLVQNSKRWQLDSGCKKLTLSVSVGNEKVLEFYKKAGYFPRTVNLSYIYPEYRS